MKKSSSMEISRNEFLENWKILKKSREKLLLESPIFLLESLNWVKMLNLWNRIIRISSCLKTNLKFWQKNWILKRESFKNFHAKLLTMETLTSIKSLKNCFKTLSFWKRPIHRLTIRNSFITLNGVLNSFTFTMCKKVAKTKLHSKSISRFQNFAELLSQMKVESFASVDDIKTTSVVIGCLSTTQL